MIDGSGWPLGAERAEDNGAHGDRSENRAGEDEILPERAGDKGNAVFVGELVVFLNVG